MQTEFIITTLLDAAAFLKHPLEGLAVQAVRDAYVAAKTYLKQKLGKGSEAAKALELATEKPESLMRKAVLAEECAAVSFECDAALMRLIDGLAEVLPRLTSPASQNVEVSGRGNRVEVAGRDLIRTEKIVRRNTITLDARHLTVEQRDRLRRVINELAERLAIPGVRGGVAAAHAMLQRRFEVPSYLMIPRDRFEDALSFLRQQRAAHRSRLRQRDPVGFANDLYRAIFAGARELGWSGESVYRFAADKLSLKRPLASLKDLGPLQLQSLADAVRREVRIRRDRNNGAVAADPISGEDGASAPEPAAGVESRVAPSKG